MKIVEVIVAATLFLVAVYVATLFRLQFYNKAKNNTMHLVFINAGYLSFLCIIMLIIFTKFGIAMSSQALFSLLLLVFILIIVQSKIDDIVAFTIVSLSNMYKVGDLVKSGPYTGQITDITPLSTVIENHFTQTRTLLPHNVLYNTIESI